ncbi:hypothetical protein Cgig2_019112 [Carnegiea gigantea]|uniref:RING-type E3 ubiquitin transferase n=1 Tax=Carnegiea gigantea TaxID=171969 RepID=A0A9Q1KDX3_9CARY|nr:hypothetical protein Cgig2_019112 [Carnegiea gigantea]
MVIKDPKQSPKISPKISSNQSLNQPETNSMNNDSMFSPRFKSAAAMAGWDEETLLLASLVVEDTPDRNFRDKKKKRSDSQFKTPPSSSRRKRRAQQRSVVSIPVTVFNLDDDDEPTSNNQGVDENKKAESESVKKDVPQKAARDEKGEPSGPVSCSSSSTLPCMDRLREELSCAICLEICFEPSTTPCGHSFCKKCLRSAADKCGKRCPKCRQLISNGRSCTVNTVLWNTIQLLFPEEVKARKEAGALNSREAERQSPGRIRHNNSNLHNSRRNQPEESRRAEASSRSRRAVPSQDEDAALALRLQREEFMEIYRGRSSLARDNLRAMAQRAISNRIRTRAV